MDYLKLYDLFSISSFAKKSFNLYLRLRKKLETFDNGDIQKYKYTLYNLAINKINLKCKTYDNK